MSSSKKNSGKEKEKAQDNEESRLFKLFNFGKKNSKKKRIVKVVVLHLNQRVELDLTQMILLMLMILLMILIQMFNSITKV